MVLFRQYQGGTKYNTLNDQLPLDRDWQGHNERNGIMTIYEKYGLPVLSAIPTISRQLVNQIDVNLEWLDNSRINSLLSLYCLCNPYC